MFGFVISGDTVGCGCIAGYLWFLWMWGGQLCNQINLRFEMGAVDGKIRSMKQLNSSVSQEPGTSKRVSTTLLSQLYELFC